MHELYREQPLVTAIRIVGSRSQAAVAIVFSGYTGADMIGYDFGANPRVTRTRVRDAASRGVCSLEISAVPGQSLDDLALRLFAIWDSYNDRGLSLSWEQSGQLSPDQSALLAADFAAAGRPDIARHLSGDVLPDRRSRARSAARELSQAESNAYLAELIRVKRRPVARRQMVAAQR